MGRLANAQDCELCCDFFALPLEHRGSSAQHADEYGYVPVELYKEPAGQTSLTVVWPSSRAIWVCALTHPSLHLNYAVWHRAESESVPSWLGHGWPLSPPKNSKRSFPSHRVTSIVTVRAGVRTSVPCFRSLHVSKHRGTFL